MRFSCRITKTGIQTRTHNILYLLLFHYNNGHTKAPGCYVVRTLPVLFKSGKRSAELNSKLSPELRVRDNIPIKFQ
jgi:hypothetical protein